MIKLVPHWIRRGKFLRAALLSQTTIFSFHTLQAWNAADVHTKLQAESTHLQRRGHLISLRNQEPLNPNALTRQGMCMVRLL